MEASLVHKEQGGQEPFALPAEVAINHESGLQASANEGHNGRGEIAGIRLN